jgi:nitrite reductase/ring-hydroxylating ferredoxin subunit
VIVRIVLSEAQRAAIARGEFVRTDLGTQVEIALAFEEELLVTRTALVGRAKGLWRAYANVCRHRAIPLDFGAETAMNEERTLLACHQHGALYRPEDGECVAGPCMGAHLAAIDVHEDDGALVLRIPSPAPRPPLA